MGSPPCSAAAPGRASAEYPASLDLVLEDLARAPEDGRGPGLGDAHLDARHLRVVEPVEDQEVPGVVHHRDDHGRAPAHGLRLRGVGDGPRRPEGEDLLGGEGIGGNERSREGEDEREQRGHAAQ